MKSSQKNILPHSQAKLDLYQKYLERYFTILGLAKRITKVNIYDVFSGTGIYENGKAGSPILAFEKVRENRTFFKEKNWSEKLITLTINDVDKSKIELVQSYIEELNSSKICEVKYFSSDTSILFPQLVKELENQSRFERNLLFIDPYGYKTIDPFNIKRLLDNKRTEIILFLPVSFMHRFKNVALTEDRKCYQALNDFIKKLFSDEHPILTPESLSIENFIEYITEGFNFQNEFYCVNHTIERSKGNLFAVFFITSHIYGLERMLAVKWEEDKEFGKGHRIKSAQKSLFEKDEKEEIQSINYVWLSRNLHDFIERKNQISNLDLYEFTLTKGFLPKHTNQILRDWDEQNSLFTIDAVTGIEFRKPRTFHNKWDAYKERKPKIFIKLK